MRVAAFSLFLLLSAVCAPVIAQTTPLEEMQKAVVVFDIRLDTIRGSALAQELKLTEKLSAMRAQSGHDGLDLTKIDRIFGAMSAPENMESAMALQANQIEDLPVDFFVRMYLNEEAAADVLFAKIENENGGTVVHDGRTFYKMPEMVGAPTGLLIHKVDAKTIDFGTETYLFQPDRNVLTANLAAAAQGKPDAAVRMAIDFSGAKELMAELMAAAKQNAPNPMFEGFIDLIDNIKDLAIILDVSGGDLVSVKATGVNQADAIELKEGLDGLLFLGKTSIQGMLPMIREQDPDGAAVMEKIAESLNATNENETVKIAIPTPEGFSAWVVQQAAAMFEQF